MTDRAKGNTMLAVFAADSDYFDPSPHPFLLNFRVDDLDAIMRTCGHAASRSTSSRPNRTAGSRISSGPRT